MNERVNTVDEDYVLAMEHFRARDYKEANRLLDGLCSKGQATGSTKNRYSSAKGMVQIFLGDKSGLNLCRNAASSEDIDGDVFFNVAQAELKLRHRGKAVAAIGRGLQVDSDHDNLLALREAMGERRSPPLPFLSRNNPVNKLLGKLSYVKNSSSKKDTNS